MENELCNECKNLAYGKYLANMAKEQRNTYLNLNLCISIFCNHLYWNEIDLSPAALGLCATRTGTAMTSRFQICIFCLGF